MNSSLSMNIQEQEDDNIAEPEPEAAAETAETGRSTPPPPGEGDLEANAKSGKNAEETQQEEEGVDPTANVSNPWIPNPMMTTYPMAGMVPGYNMNMAAVYSQPPPGYAAYAAQKNRSDLEYERKVNQFLAKTGALDKPSSSSKPGSSAILRDSFRDVRVDDIESKVNDHFRRSRNTSESKSDSKDNKPAKKRRTFTDYPVFESDKEASGINCCSLVLLLSF